MGEKELQQMVIQLLQIMENKGELFYQRVNNTPVYDPTRKVFRSMGKGVKKGFPDIIIIKNGKFIGIELKGDKGVVSKEQKEVGKEIIDNGGEYHIVKELDQLIEILK